MKVGAFIVHLERARQRRPQVEHLRQTLPLETAVIDAVDGAALTVDELSSVYVRHLLRPHYPFELSATEIGCFLSHRKAWRAILDSGLDAGLVVEDDVELDMATFAPGLRLATDAVGGGTLVRFPNRLYGDRGRTLSRVGGSELVEPRRIGLGMIALLIDRLAASRLLDLTERFDRPVDTFVQLRWHHGIPVRVVRPSGVVEMSSKLGGTTLRRDREPIARPQRNLKRALYRLQIALRSALMA